MSKLPQCVCILALVCLVAGCGQRDTRNLPATVTATGYVTLDGNPIEGAVVVFLPEDPKGYPAQGITNARGYFELQAFEKKKGAVPGKYKIQVSKTVEIPAEAASAKGMTEEAEHAMEAKGGVFYKNVLPQKYASIATSGLAAEIPPSGTTDLKIELSSKP